MYKIHTMYETNVPTSVFTDRVLSPLEAVVEFLKEKHNFSYKEISIILNRDERNIWTVYNRAKKKRENARH